MNIYFVAASVVAFLVGSIHSVLGEVLIFRRMRKGGLIPVNGGQVIHERHVRILWASWHVLTVFGWFIAATLVGLSAEGVQQDLQAFMATAVILATSAGALFVLVGTKGRHPGWAGLISVAVLVWVGMGD